MPGYFDGYELEYRENTAWSNWGKKARRAKILQRAPVTYQLWANRQRSIAQDFRPGALFFMENAIISAGEKDNTWRPFLDVPTGGNILEWPAKVWVPPWAATLRAWILFWFNTADDFDLRAKLGSINGAIETFSGWDAGVWNSYRLDIEGISAYAGTEQDFEIEYRINGGAITYLGVRDGGNPDSGGIRYYRGVQWIPEA